MNTSPIQIISLLWGLLAGCGAAPADPADSNAAIRDDEPQAIRALPDFYSGFVNDPVFGGKLYIMEAGPVDAPPVVLVHGVGAQGSADWYPVLEELSQHYRVLAMDLPGFGRSDLGEAPYSPDNYVQALHELTRHRIGKPFFLLGHSMGGAIALLWAGTYPTEVRRLVLADVAGILHRHALADHMDKLIAEGDNPVGMPGPVRGLTHGLKQILKVTDVSPGEIARSRTVGGMLRDTPQAAAALLLIDFNFGPTADRIVAPTQLLWGRNDNTAPLRTARALLARISDSQLTIFEQSGHVPMNTEPEAFVRAVRGHFQAAAPSPLSSPTASPSQGDGQCRNRTGVRFEGVWDTLTIEHCADVVLSGVTAKHIAVTDSTATIDDTVIDGSDIGLFAAHSRISMTGGRISGRIAVDTLHTGLDLAGVHLVGTERAFSEPSSGELIASICKVESPLFDGTLHTLTSFDAKNPLEER